MIIIHNYRRGFATNSSSSHSIIIDNTNECKNHIISETSFSWETFVLKSKEMKEQYFFSSIISSIIYYNTEQEIDLCQQISDYIFGKNKFNIKDINVTEHYVDHQSCFYIPKYQDGEYAVEFYKQFVDEIINNDELVIVGGHDNHGCIEYSKKQLKEELEKEKQDINYIRELKEDIIEEEHFLKELDKLKVTGKSTFNTAIRPDEHYICFKDGNNWILFSTRMGNKITIEITNSEEFKRCVPSFPHLIDYKITSKCKNKCSYCYNNSMPDGKHVSLEDFENHLIWMKKNHIMEVAIGGGNVLEHPNLVIILERFKKANIVANITLHWSDFICISKEQIKILKPLVGAFGVSIENISHAEKVGKYIEEHAIYHTVFHMIIGKCINDFDEVQSVCELIQRYKNTTWYDISVLLLGFKNTGRADGITPVIHKKNYLKSLSKFLNVKIGVDTKFVQMYDHHIKELNIPHFLYFKEEGIWSKYIDGLENTISDSSYDQTNKIVVAI